MEATTDPLSSLLGIGADARLSGASAIEGLHGDPLTHGELDHLIGDLGALLASRGVGRTECVATVLPNGPDTAVAFLGIASVAACAPLNPAYTAVELDFYMRDLQPAALMVHASDEGPAREVARAHDIELIEIVPIEHAHAGEFTAEIRRPRRQRSSPVGHTRHVGPDTALLLHTSGTTSRPKLVPITRANLRSSTATVASVLELSPADRCLNVMPLFHVHGIVAALLAPLAAGGSVVCAPGFRSADMIQCLPDKKPTWYTAVPTIHHALLGALGSDSRVTTSLRFVRSSSAALAPALMHALERAIDVPVIEAYGMTEAAHQIASNPLPPRPRKPGSVGMATGSEIAILDSSGAVLPTGATGEIAIRGPNVMSGYVGAPEANAASFADGWLRTGDEGRLDEDAYLTITGRLKEIINRGGEKISPREIDEVLMDHPAVESAVAFAVPDPALGEAVAAAVVVRDGMDLGEQELRAFVGERLARFKVPTRIVLVREIPKGPTGKIQRIGLAERLGLAGRSR